MSKRVHRIEADRLLQVSECTIVPTHLFEYKAAIVENSLIFSEKDSLVGVRNSPIVLASPRISHAATAISGCMSWVDADRFCEVCDGKGVVALTVVSKAAAIICNRGFWIEANHFREVRDRAVVIAIAHQ